MRHMDVADSERCHDEVLSHPVRGIRLDESSCVEPEAKKPDVDHSEA